MSDMLTGWLIGAAIFATLFGIVAWGIWRSGEWDDE